MAQIHRTKLTKEQGFALVEAFQKSNLKSSRFCIQRNIQYSVLYYWLSKAKKVSNHKRDKGCFLPVKLNSSPSIFSKAPLRVLLNSSITVEIPSGFDMVAFKQLLEVCRDVANR
jgi:hypothetical protein